MQETRNKKQETEQQHNSTTAQTYRLNLRMLSYHAPAFGTPDVKTAVKNFTAVLFMLSALGYRT
ncbi:MAG: hypothetical protein ACRC8G_17055 [Plesiomonas shigelloides]